MMSGNIECKACHCTSRMMARCLSSGCGQVYCNHVQRGSNFSDIVKHLKRSKHSSIETTIFHHPDLYFQRIKCKFCEESSIFKLGFVESAKREVVCLKDFNKRFGNKRRFSFFLEENILYNEVFYENPSYGRFHLEQNYILKSNESITGKIFNSKENLIYYFSTLLMFESDEEKNLKIKKKFELHILEIKKSSEIEEFFENVSIDLIVLLRRHEITHKTLSRRIGIIDYEDTDNDLYNVKIVSVSSKEVENWIDTAQIMKADNNSFLLIFDEEIPENLENIKITFEKDSDSYEIIEKGLNLLKNQDIDHQIMNVLQGKVAEAPTNVELIDVDYTAEGRLELNPSQMNAINSALTYKFSIIQGPPGTGKTQTISSLVYALYSLCNNEKSYSSHNYFASSCKILITSASNNPVFDLRKKLKNLDLPILHVLAKSKQLKYKNDEGTLHYIVDLELKNDIEYKSLKSSLKTSPDFEKILKKIKHIEKETVKRILNEYQIVCCTTRVIPSTLFNDIQFDFVIIDEASQCIEVDPLLCLLRNPKHIVLVGDTKQLGPVIKSKCSKDLGLGISTIERLECLGVPKSLLDTQYRMNKLIAEFPNNTFYEGRIKTKKNPRPLNGKRCVKCPLLFLKISSSEESEGSSFKNQGEAKKIIRIIKYFRQKDIPSDHIGVISFYAAQRDLISQINKQENPNYIVDVMSVDASQGREKEIIILSCVRSNSQQSIGFINDPRRLNVAMTRAKECLIICGNIETLYSDSLFSQLINFCKTKKVIVGELPRLF